MVTNKPPSVTNTMEQYSYAISKRSWKLVSENSVAVNIYFSLMKEYENMSKYANR